MKKITSFILILSLIFTFTIGSTSIAYADGNDLLNSLNEGITTLIENGAENLQTVLNMIDDLIKYTVEKFSDIKVSDWFTKTVSKLVGMGGIDGYPDGTFKPDKEMNKGEFTKLLISTLGYEEENATGEHWSMNYIRRAEKLDILDKGEFKENALDSSITRYEMAKMVVKALDEEYPKNIDKYANQIKDYEDIPYIQKEYVLKAYVKGIITGYPNGTFKGYKGLTRAEASTVVVRIIDETERKVPELILTDKIIIDGEEKEVQAKEIIKPYNEMIKMFENAEGYYKVQYSDAYNEAKIYYTFKEEPNLTGYICNYDFIISIDLEKDEELDLQYRVAIYTFDENTYSIIKEILKILYPESYEQALDIVKNTADTKGESKDKYLDNRRFGTKYFEMTEEVCIYIGGDR